MTSLENDDQRAATGHSNWELAAGLKITPGPETICALFNMRIVLFHADGI